MYQLWIYLFVLLFNYKQTNNNKTQNKTNTNKTNKFKQKKNNNYPPPKKKPPHINILNSTTKQLSALFR